MKFNEIVSSIADKEQTIKQKSKKWVQSKVEQQVVRFQGSRVGKYTAGIKGWLTLERIIALILLFFPFLLIAVDGWPTGDNDSISAYYTMNY